MKVKVSGKWEGITWGGVKKLGIQKLEPGEKPGVLSDLLRISSEFGVLKHISKNEEGEQ